VLAQAAPEVRAIAEAGAAAILGGRSLADFNAAYLARHGGGCLRARAAAVEAAALLAPGERQAAAALLLDGCGPVGARPHGTAHSVQFPCKFVGAPAQGSLAGGASGKHRPYPYPIVE